MHVSHRFSCVNLYLMHCQLEMNGNIFFNSIPSYSRWFIPTPIPNLWFSLGLFPFKSHSHWLFPFPPAPILVLLVVSHLITNDRWTQQCTEQYCYKKNSTKSLKNTSSIKASSVSWTSRAKPNLRVYNKLGLLCKNKSVLTVSDDQLLVGGKWENVRSLYSLPFPSSQSHSHFHSH